MSDKILGSQALNSLPPTYDHLMGSRGCNTLPLDLAGLYLIYCRMEGEFRRQHKKFGNQHLTPAQWYVVLGEEYGEVGRAVCDNDHDGYVAELLQVAAVALRAIECYKKYGTCTDTE